METDMLIQNININQKKGFLILLYIWIISIFIMLSILFFSSVQTKLWDIFFCIFATLTFILFFGYTKLLIYDELKYNCYTSVTLYISILTYVFVGILTSIAWVTNTKIMIIKIELFVTFSFTSLFMLPIIFWTCIIIKDRFIYLDNLQTNYGNIL